MKAKPAKEKKSRRNSFAIPMRAINLSLGIFGGVLSVVLLVVAFKTTVVYQNMQEAVTRYEACLESGVSMQQASDYLTDRARTFTQTGEIVYANEYFIEINETQRREKAVQTLLHYYSNSTFNSYLEIAMSFSSDLETREKYAIRLAAEGYGLDLSEFPRAIQKISLYAEDASLQPEEQLVKAREMMFDEIYRAHKEEIQTHLDAFAEQLAEYAQKQQKDAAEMFRDHLFWQISLVIANLLVIILMLILIYILIVLPLDRGARSITREEQLPVHGCREMQILADSYNAMYNKTREEQNKLTYEAEHDALTGLYNRIVFDRVCRKVYYSTPMAVVLIDVDHFKLVNDTYGHQVGDGVLKRVADHLKTSFRSEDYVCRIGGDEFVIIMSGANANIKQLLINKIGSITNRLVKAEKELPAVTLSVGIAFGERGCDMEKLYKNADVALYRVKNEGRNGLKFY